MCRNIYDTSTIHGTCGITGRRARLYGSNTVENYGKSVSNCGDGKNIKQNTHVYSIVSVNSR